MPGPLPILQILALGLLGAAVAPSCGSPERGAPRDTTPAAHAGRAGERAPAAEPAPVVSEVVMVEDELDAAEHDGRWLYERNCAGCHASNGDGRGETMLQLGLVARDFAQGGFAFGNTREAIYHTITAGMPGSSVMPSFRGVLDDDERWRIVDFVLTLCPAPEAPASGTRLAVADRPRVARGLLPAVAEGKPRWPRGLLLGSPEGLTFEYRTDDVRLLAVRQGEFADRTDWNGRGGGELVPLGQAFYAPGGGDPGPTFRAVEPRRERELAARLVATVALADELGLDYRLVDKQGRSAGSVRERVRAEALSIGGAFTRTLELSSGGDAVNLLVQLGRAEVERAGGAAQPGGGEADGVAQVAQVSWVRGEPGAWQVTGTRLRGALPDDGWLVGQRGARFELVRVDADRNVKLIRDSDGLSLYVPMFQDATPGAARVALTIVVASEWSEELLAKLSRELAP